MGEEGGSRELNFYDTLAKYCQGEFAKCLFLKACCIYCDVDDGALRAREVR